MAKLRIRVACAAGIVVALGAGAVTSCDSEPESTSRPSSSPSATQTAGQTTTPTATPTATHASDGLPPGDVVEAYFAAVASYDPGQLAGALTSTESDSVAANYAGYLLALSTASIDGGSPVDGAEIKPVEGGGFSACGGTGRPSDCVVWADFVGHDGKLVDFTVNGQELDSRLSAGNGASVSAGKLGAVSFEFGYQSVQSQDLFVVLRVAADENVTILSERATYTTPGGDRLDALRWIGPTGVAAGDAAIVVLVFPQVAIGGEVDISLVGPDQRTKSVQIKTG